MHKRHAMKRRFRQLKGPLRTHFKCSEKSEIGAALRERYGA